MNTMTSSLRRLAIAVAFVAAMSLLPGPSFAQFTPRGPWDAATTYQLDRSLAPRPRSRLTETLGCHAPA